MSRTDDRKMRRQVAVGVALLFAGLACLFGGAPSRSQTMMMSGAGRGSPAPVFSLCTGTALQIVNTNTPSPFWQPPTNSSTTTGITDPTSGTAAWSNTASPVNFAFIDFNLTGGAAGTTPLSNTTYSVEGYAKTLAFSANTAFIIGSNSFADQTGITLNLTTGAAASSVAGTGSLSCANTETAPNGYIHFSFAGIITTGTMTSPVFRFWLNDSDGNFQSHSANSVAIFNVAH